MISESTLLIYEIVLGFAVLVLLVCIPVIILLLWEKYHK